MKHFSTILLFAVCIGCPLMAQTPYDAFSPATSRPILSLEATSPAAEEVESVDSDLVATQIVDDVYKWLSVDPLSDKYPNISPYAYCGWNPINIIDDKGDSTRLWVETEGVGHTWITTGEGDDMQVYSYGRYDDLTKDKSRFRSLSFEGEGVLLRLTGDDAKQYQNKKLATDNIRYVVVSDLSDERVNEYFDKMFYSSTEMPSNPNSKYYHNPNAHVIDKYNLFYNNCTTKSVMAINNLGSRFFQKNYIPSPNGKGYNVTYNKLFITPLALSYYMLLR